MTTHSSILIVKNMEWFKILIKLSCLLIYLHFPSSLCIHGSYYPLKAILNTCIPTHTKIIMKQCDRHYPQAIKEALGIGHETYKNYSSIRFIPGIYNSPFRKDPDPWELRLQKAKPLTHRGPNVKRKPCVSLSNWLACTSARSFPRSGILPPIDRKRCQGPFRDISEVLEQRYKPLEPTLRVAEPMDGLTEARAQLQKEESARNVNDNIASLFSFNLHVYVDRYVEKKGERKGKRKKGG
ncbi:hypothetical protein FD754_020762 [Muntiacus muntjak]|uniref:Uncharacterized protein n=1 Tax=Muntiacus muntjak TaxID=9888 RepID=A0A5N3V3V7_MUNMU|nr:hypothetical protein FD754_020762 [Muntiacus muntjak]